MKMAGCGNEASQAIYTVRRQPSVRMDKAQAAQSLKNAQVKPFDITGKPMAGWVMVHEAGWKSAAGLAKWLDIGKQFARSLPEKQRQEKSKKKTLREYRAL